MFGFVFSEEVAIKHRLDELSTAHPFYGSRKLTTERPHQALAYRRPAELYLG